MSNPVPNQLALTNIADGSPRIAAPIRNNYSSIQVAVNALIAALSGGSAGQVLHAADSGDVEWGEGTSVVYRKTTPQTVAATVAETDLLNGEFTLGAHELSTNLLGTLVAWGDWKQNSGAAIDDFPQFKAKLGATTIFDTGPMGFPGAGDVHNSVSRFGWRIAAEIFNLGAANSQWATIEMSIGALIQATGAVARHGAFATGEGGWEYGADTIPVVRVLRALASNSAAVDTTVAQPLQLTVINPSNNANVETKLLGAIFKVE